MKSIIRGILGLAIFLFFTFPVLGQEMPEVKKKEGVSWNEVVLIDFKPGKTDDAMEIVNNKFKKALQQADLPGPEKELHMATGPWDVMLVWEMDSLSQMEWEFSPDNQKFLKALADIEGNIEAAFELFEKYQAMIDENTMYLATSDIKDVK